jgi:hypothetical protein
LEKFLITSKASDARRRGATTEAYEAIRRKPVESLQVEREERAKATPLEPCEIPSRRGDHALMVDQGSPSENHLFVKVEYDRPFLVLIMPLERHGIQNNGQRRHDGVYEPLILMML